MDVVLWQNTQNIITFMVRWENFPPHHEGLPWPRTWKWTRITPRNTPGTLFHVVLRRFRRSWASILAQKMVYRTVYCKYLLKYWTKLNKCGRILLTLNFSCLQYLLGFPNRPNQKVINVQIWNSSNFRAIPGDPNFGTTKHLIYPTSVSVLESPVSGESPHIYFVCSFM